MTRYDNVENYFVNMIAEGYDEWGAYTLTRKKYGKLLADKVYATALGLKREAQKNEIRVRKYVRPRTVDSPYYRIAREI